MPLSVKWSKFTHKNLEKLDPFFGVYELGDKSKNVIYIGQGILSERLLAHKNTDKHCLEKAQYFRCEKTGSKQRAEQRERAEMNSYESNFGTLPNCNKRRESPPRTEWWE